MCYLYSQKNPNRVKEIKLILCEFYPDKFYISDFTSEENQILFDLASSFESFLEKVIPKTISASKKLLKIATIFYKIKGEVEIKTLDGIILKWEHFKSEPAKEIRVVHPINHKIYRVSYKTIVKNKQNISKMRSAFLPNLTHSIDG